MEPKIPYLGILARKFERLSLDLKSASSNLLKYKKLFKTKKKANLGPKMSYLGILSCKFEKLLIYLKSTTSNLSKCFVQKFRVKSFVQKQKSLKVH